MPGVSFVKEGVKQWTPVVRRRRVRRNANSGSSESSDLELDLTNCQANYLTRYGTPGIARKNRAGGSYVWTPIAARTRRKTKHKT